MVYVKIHDDRYISAEEAEEYLEDDIGEGLCFYGNRDYGFIGNDKMKSIYKAINEYVDDDTDIEDLEYYFKVDTAKAEEIHDILVKCYDKRIIKEDELFQAVAEVVMGKSFYRTILRGSAQGEWVECLYPGEFSSYEYEDYLTALFFGTGVWVEISEDPYFDMPYWEYIPVPYANEKDVKGYFEDYNIDNNVMIVDDDWNYDEYNSPHDADNLYDDTNYDFESLQLKRPVKESLDSHGVDVDSIETFTPTIREWYLSEYPDDDSGEEIEDETFAMLYHTLRGGYDVYDVIGVGDSIIRERLFSKLAELGKVDYDIIYDMWLDGYAPSRKANLTLRDF